MNLTGRGPERDKGRVHSGRISQNFSRLFRSVKLARRREHIDDPTDRLKRLLTRLFPLSEAAVAEANRTVTEIEKFVSVTVLRLAQRLAGPFLRVMLESRVSAESFLTHADPKLRCAAIIVLSMHWGNSAEFAQTCDDLLRSDPSLKVRLQALAAIEGFYGGTDNLRIGGMVARMVLEDSLPLELRRAAYRSLFSIRGMPTAALLKAASPTFRFPEDVDWPFLESFYSERE